MAAEPRSISRDELKARWAYGELLSPHKAEAYVAAGLVGLAAMARMKMRFELLEAEDRYRLSDALATVRGPGLAAAVDTHARFRLESWSKARLAQCFVVSQFDLPRRARQLPYYDFLLATEVPQIRALMGPDDPRILAEGAPSATGMATEHPVAVYPFPTVLVDGYQRSIRFFRTAGPHDLLQVWVGA